MGWWQALARASSPGPLCGPPGPDLGRALANFYHHLQQGLKPLPYTENNEDYYYACRELFNRVVRDGNLHWALLVQLFWYFNRAGFNGLIRFNKRGEFNTPFGRYKNPNLSPDFAAHTAAMQGWTVKHAHFRDAEIPAGSFLYCDPPYPNTFNSYSSEGFSWNEHVELAQRAAQHDGPTVVSNSADAEVLNLYRAQGFSVQVVQAPRSISCKADGRKPKEEMLATRNL